MPLDPLRADDPTTLGRWTLEGRLGAGGMGVVYLATGPDGERVALKLVRADLADDPMFRTRFRREVDAVGRVRGERVARLIEADPDAAQPYLVVEFVDGPTLNQAVMEAGPMRGERLVAFAAALAEAVVSIHRAGVVHRDLKPSNVLLTGTAPKVVDFGVASSTEATAITRAGLVLGSPGWMAPEQLTGGATTPAIDVFTWASVVTYTGTGHPPFGEGRTEAIAYRIVHEQPALGGLASPVRQLVARAFAKDPADRPEMDDVLAELVHQADDDPAQLSAETTRLLAADWSMPSMLWVPVPPTPAEPRLSPAAARTQSPSPSAARTQSPSPSAARTQSPSPSAARTQRPARSAEHVVVPPQPADPPSMPTVAALPSTPRQVPTAPPPPKPRRGSWLAGATAFVLVVGGGLGLAWWLTNDADEQAGGDPTTTTAEPRTTTTTLPPIGDVTVAMTVQDNVRRVVDDSCESAPPFDDISWRFDDPATGERLVYTSTVDEGVAVPGDQDVFGGIVDDVFGRDDQPTHCVYSGVMPAVPDRDEYVLVSSIPGDTTDELTYTKDDLADDELTITLEAVPSS
jgi:serine/threonine protein kinase